MKAFPRRAWERETADRVMVDAANLLGFQLVSLKHEVLFREWSGFPETLD